MKEHHSSLNRFSKKSWGLKRRFPFIRKRMLSFERILYFSLKDQKRIAIWKKFYTCTAAKLYNLTISWLSKNVVTRMYATNTKPNKLRPTKQNQKPKNKSLGPTGHKPKTRAKKTKVLGPTGHQPKPKPKSRFWFLVFRKTKKTKTKKQKFQGQPARDPKPKTKTQLLAFVFSKNQKPKVEFWFLFRGFRPVGPKNFCFFGFWFFEKPKTNTPVLVLVRGSWPDWPWNFWFFGFSKKKQKTLKMLKSPWFLSYFLTTNNKNSCFS